MPNTFKSGFFIILYTANNMSNSHKNRKNAVPDAVRGLPDQKTAYGSIRAEMIRKDSIVIC